MHAQPHRVTTPDKPPWHVIAPLCLTVFVGLVMATALGPFVSKIADDLDVSIGLVGQVNTAALIMIALGGLVSGPLADQYGHRWSILLGLTIMASASLLIAVTPAYSVLLLAGLIAGLGASMTFGVAFAVAVSLFDGDTRRMALSRVQASQTMGSILGAPILTTIAAFALWRGAYVFVACALMGGVALVARGLPPDPAPSKERPSVEAMLSSYRPLVQDRGMLALYAASALRAIGWVGPVLYIGAFYTEVHNLSIQQVGLAYMVTSGGLFLGNLAAGGRLGGFDLRMTFAVATALVALGWAAVFALPLAVGPTVAIAAATAFAGGVSWISLTTLLASETPAGPATTMVLNMSVFGLGSALGTAAGGILIGIGGFQMLGIGFPLFPLAAALLTWRPRLAIAPAARGGAADAD